jgi:16S rRNA processing protein RimM
VTDPEATPPDDAVEVGRIVDAWGIQGGFKVQPFSSDPQALFSTKRWYLRAPEGPQPVRKTPLPGLLRISKAREQAGLVVANAHDIDDRNAAEALKGARVFVPRASFPTPDEGEFYWIDLIGLDVFNREGAALGQVVGLIETGAHAVLRVQPATPPGQPEAEERLIPFVGAYVDAVDLAARRISVDWGLDY